MNKYVKRTLKIGNKLVNWDLKWDANILVVERKKQKNKYRESDKIPILVIDDITIRPTIERFLTSIYKSCVVIRL